MSQFQDLPDEITKKVFFDSAANYINKSKYIYVKFIYSEKATKFCEISTNYLTGST